jgi:hypothetical protein
MLTGRAAPARVSLNRYGMITGMERRSRLLARIFAVCGVLLVPWTVVLIAQLHGQAGKRSFDSSWVGLDLLEAVCLLTVARLLSRRHRATSPVAAATAAILCMDAWFDTWSAAPKLPYAEALAMAWFAELPLAALLAWTAWRALGWAAPRAVTASPAGDCDRAPEPVRGNLSP